MYNYFVDQFLQITFKFMIIFFIVTRYEFNRAIGIDRRIKNITQTTTNKIVHIKKRWHFEPYFRYRIQFRNNEWVMQPINVFFRVISQINSRLHPSWTNWNCPVTEPHTKLCFFFSFFFRFFQIPDLQCRFLYTIYFCRRDTGFFVTLVNGQIITLWMSLMCSSYFWVITVVGSADQLFRGAGNIYGRRNEKISLS